jgi:hypothetical protein
MHEFTIRDKSLCLNGKPLYLRATFFEGLCPVKLAYPDSREMAIRETSVGESGRIQHDSAVAQTAAAHVA